MNDFSIGVATRYVEGESDPGAQRFVFAYTITISNEGGIPAQLLNRHWVITDGNGEVKEVEGPGVVGKQPLIEPGQSFRYTSGCVLPTPVGTMHGEYEFRREDDSRFHVPIPAFSLVLPSMIH